MARHLEIERKFLVTHPPRGWRRRASQPVVQGYFPLGASEVEVRLRRIGSRHVLTIKGGHGQQRLEEEIEIRPAQFRALWPLTRAARIAKRRYRIPCAGGIVELDVYRGPHRGLITAEIEFASIAASRAFQPPSWLGREITGRRSHANAALARRQRVPATPR